MNVAGNVLVNGINGSFVVADADNTTRGILAAANVAGNFSSDAAAKDVVLRAESGQKLLLQSNTGASAIAITTDNKVGIGTNAPGTKLDVRGDTSISGTTSLPPTS